MQALLKAGLPVASSCYGDGVCGKCRLEVIDGEASLSEAQDLEKTLCERLRIKSPMRISCQATVMGDITVDTTYW